MILGPCWTVGALGCTTYSWEKMGVYQGAGGTLRLIGVDGMVNPLVTIHVGGVSGHYYDAHFFEATQMEREGAVV